MRLKRFIPVVLVAFVLFYNANVKAITPTPTLLPCGESAGEILRNTFTSKLRNEDFVYSIYLPPCYETSDAIYPVLYLMHGSDSDDRLWIRLGMIGAINKGIKEGTLPPFVLVLPYGGNIANVNTFRAQSWGGVFVNELMPEVESKYRVSKEADLRAIGGISRGGFWAYQIALSNPALFGIVGGHSAVFTPENAIPQYNPLSLVITAKDIEPIRFWLDRGKDDWYGSGMELMVQTIKKRGLLLEYNVHPGTHNNAYWSAHIEGYLKFYTASWQ
jgi:enterochelin esterase-like enzyme